MLNNANYGGAIKCDNCILTLTDSDVRDNDAFDGGAIYSVNKITFTATRTAFYNNKAKNNSVTKIGKKIFQSIDNLFSKNSSTSLNSLNQTSKNQKSKNSNRNIIK